MEGSPYNPCDDCVATHPDVSPCEVCRFEAAKKRLARLEEIQKKCLGAYGILGEAFEPRQSGLDRLPAVWSQTILRQPGRSR
jgi:hypothetical protein